MLESIHAPLSRWIASYALAFAAVGLLGVSSLVTAQVPPAVGPTLRVDVLGVDSFEALAGQGATIVLPPSPGDAHADGVLVRVTAEAIGAESFRFELDGVLIDISDAERLADAPIALEIPLRDAADDAEEFLVPSRANPERWPAGFTFVGSSDLELGYDPSHGPQSVAVRFSSAGVPGGAKISHARVIFTADGDSGDPLQVTIAGERSPDAERFVQDPDGVGSRGLTRRSRTDTSVTWVLEEHWSRGSEYLTPDLTAVLQEIVDLEGWNADSAIVLFFDGVSADTAFRRAYAFEGSRGDRDVVARLVLEYDPPESVASASVTLPVLPDRSVLTVTPFPRTGGRGLAQPAATVFLVRSPPEAMPVPHAVDAGPTVTRVDRVPVRAPGSDIVFGELELVGFDNATTGITVTWDRAPASPVLAWVVAGSCAAPGEALVELRPLDVEDGASQSKLPVAASALRWGGFAMVLRDAGGSVIGCANLTVYP